MNLTQLCVRALIVSFPFVKYRLSFPQQVVFISVHQRCTSCESRSLHSLCPSVLLQTHHESATGRSLETRNGSLGVQSILSYCLCHCMPLAVLSLALFPEPKGMGKLKNRIFKF